MGAHGVVCKPNNLVVVKVPRRHLRGATEGFAAGQRAYNALRTLLTAYLVWENGSEWCIPGRYVLTTRITTLD
jgi:hypothetical protein